MEVADTIRFKSSQLLTFALSKAGNNELYCLASSAKAYISELNYSHYSEERFCMERSSLSDISTFKPSFGVPRDAPQIFNRATKIQQHRLLIDAQLLSQEMKVSDERIALTQIQWSPAISNLNGNYYLAYLTNFGGCEIRSKSVGKRLWNNIKHDISTRWLLECQQTMKNVLNTFEDFENALNNIKITAISWHNVNNDGSEIGIEQNPLICVITANGCIVIFEIGPELIISYQKQLNRQQIQSLQWISCRNKQNKQIRSFIITSELSGKVGLYSVEFDEKTNRVVDIVESLWLFNEADEIFANGIQWEFSEVDEQLLIVFCKGMHLFASVIDLNGSSLRLVSSINHYIGHLSINGKRL